MIKFSLYLADSKSWRWHIKIHFCHPTNQQSTLNLFNTVNSSNKSLHYSVEPIHSCLSFVFFISSKKKNRCKVTGSKRGRTSAANRRGLDIFQFLSNTFTWHQTPFSLLDILPDISAGNHTFKQPISPRWSCLAFHWSHFDGQFAKTKTKWCFSSKWPSSSAYFSLVFSLKSFPLQMLASARLH